MVDKIAFLFGAGASHGAGQVHPSKPPLMPGLYDDLAKYAPAEWGEASPNHAHADEYRHNFEETFSRVVLKIAVGDAPSFTPDSLTLLEKQRTLALYFSRFTLPPGGCDLYSKLLSCLAGSGRIQHSLFGSLNYDCLFEQAADRLGLQIDYSCEQIGQSIIRVVKLHGSCNFITERLSQNKKALLTSARTEGKVIYLPPTNLESNLKGRLSGMDPDHLPVMSQISPAKEHHYAPVKIQAIRNKWTEAITNASVVVIVGVSHNPNDVHIIHPVKQSPAEILYIGSREDFQKWALTNSRVAFIAEKFEDGVKKLLTRLGSLV